MKIIEDKSFDEERALYGLNDLELNNIKFTGAKDGESALKETENISINNSYFNLRYPLWHASKVKIKNSKFTDLARAAIWYTCDIEISDTKLLGIKAIRECQNVSLNKVEVVSQEFGWKSENLDILHSKIDAIYGFLESKNLKLNKVEFSGKYSFQYVKNLEIQDSVLDTKDAFWHADGVVVKNSIVKGEYLGWYSNNLTFINCQIIGTQPLCYAKNLKLIDCEMINTDLAFEYSEVEATIKGKIVSVKNPTKGFIQADGIDEVILKDSKYPLNCKIILNK